MVGFGFTAVLLFVLDVEKMCRGGKTDSYSYSYSYSYSCWEWYLRGKGRDGMGWEWGNEV